jgi:hypothetical protein
VCVVGACFGQQASVDKAFFGVWNLDLTKSKFGPGTGPKSGQVFVNQNGYVVSNQDAPAGMPPAVGVAIIRGECYVVGHLGLSCTANTDNPRRPNIDINMGDAVMIKTEIDLQGDTTMKVKQTNLASPNGPIVIDLVYRKQRKLLPQRRRSRSAHYPLKWPLVSSRRSDTQ